MGSKKIWIVGARDTCDIVVDQPTVSGEHCRLELVDDELFVEDLQSTNGTFVNGERIFRKKQIHRDALVTLGKSVTLPMPAQLTQPSPPSPSPRPAPPPIPPPTPEEAPFPAKLLIVSGIGVTVLLLLILFIIMAYGGGAN
ncbi:FHA domain-containing protein [bacterium]|nr:FHA domain-containing protein [bacterium]